MFVTEVGEKIVKTVDHYYRKMMVVYRSIYSRFFLKISDRPIFVVGCSRAGTTLVYKTLSLSKEIGSINKETHDLWVSLNPLKNKDWSSHSLTEADAKGWQVNFISRYFYNQTGMLRFVDKNNQNGLCIRYLNALYKDAIFIYVKRNPGDNIHSLIEGWKRSDEFGTWSDELPLNVNVDRGKFKRWCFFLFPGWERYVNSSIEEVCAKQYIEMNNAIVNDFKSISHERIYEIKYEDIISDPVKEFSNLFDFCELDFTDNLKSHSDNILKNPYNSFSKIQRNKWIASENNDRICKIISGVEAVTEKMGYKKIDYMEF